VLKAILKLMHPFIPFVTEKLFLDIFDEKSIMVSEWPKAQYNFNVIELFNEMSDAITRVRNLRAEHKVIPSKKLSISLSFRDQSLLDLMKSYEVYFVKFLNTENLSFDLNLDEKDSVLVAGANINIYVKKEGLIDLAAEKEALLKQKESLEKEIARSKGLLSNESFLAK